GRFFAEDLLDEGSVADVAVDEAEAVFRRLEIAPTRGISFQVGEVLTVAGVGQGVQHDDAVARVAGEPVVDEVRADEAGASGDQQSSHSMDLRAVRQWTGSSPRADQVADLSST